MRLEVTAAERTFRQEVQDWLRSNVPRTRRPLSGLGVRDFDTAWQRAQNEGGWAGISWPKEYGGRGLSLAQQLIWYEECAKANAPVGGAMFVALTHAGPTLIVRGSEQQKAFHLPRMLKGDAVWCQGFSEPNAGSDLAGLKTTGRIEGDEIVVNGSKIWTSYADMSDYQELLIRTDPTAAKHKGLSWVICDMKLPGITIHKIPTASGTGNLCQVFYDEVRIPISAVVGDLHDGWNVSMTTLGFERGTAFAAHQVALAETVEKLIKIASQIPGPNGHRRAIDDDAIAERLAMLRADVAALRAITLLSVSRGMVQQVPGPEGNIVALYYAELSKKVYAMAVELQGAEGIEKKPAAPRDWLTEYLDSFKNTIAGGSSQIRRNIIGERLLGLPRAK